MRGLVLSVMVLSVVSVCSGEVEVSEGGDGYALDSGIEVGLGVTNIYQQNVRGGQSVHRRAGRIAGSYDLEVEIDTDKIFDNLGGTFYIHAEGLWSKSEGIDGVSVGSFGGVNGDAGARRTMDVVEVWYEHDFGSGLKVRLGKLDITGGFEHRGCPVSFDCNSYANDETSQFLNGSLVNNPTIPFPDYGLGVVAHYNVTDEWYVSAGVADAQADGRETGFNTAFHGEDDFFYIFESGIVSEIDSSKGPLRGAYRFGVWMDGQDKEKFSDGAKVKDDTGFYVSCDQMIMKENDAADDSQGLGVFARYGWADSGVNEVGDLWSVGLQYAGLFDGRDEDVIGVGVSQSIFSDEGNANDGGGYSDDHETVCEVYYNAVINEWLNVSPSVQYVGNPGGDMSVSDAVVLGVRVQMAF